MSCLRRGVGEERERGKEGDKMLPKKRKESWLTECKNFVRNSLPCSPSHSLSPGRRKITIIPALEKEGREGNERKRSIRRAQHLRLKGQ